MTDRILAVLIGVVVTGIGGYFGVALPKENRAQAAEYEQSATMLAYELLSKQLAAYSEELVQRQARIEEQEALLEKRYASRKKWRERAEACEEQCPLVEGEP